MIHQRWQSQEILRRWTCSICGPPNCRVLDRRIASRRKVSRNITGLVRACALHWLHLTRERQRKRIMAAASSYSLITSLPPAVSSKIPLAHLPPRRLPTELLGDIIPEEFSSSEAKLSSPDRFPVVPTPSYPPSPPPPEVHSLEENPIVSLADIDRLVEGLYIKIMSGSAQNITPSERQEFYLLLTQYGELVESLKSRDASRISSLL